MDGPAPKAAAVAAAAASSTAAAAAAPKEEGGNKTWLILLVLLLVGGGIVWFAMQKKEQPKPEVVKADVPVEQPDEPEPPPPDLPPEPAGTSTGEASGTDSGSSSGTGGDSSSGGEPEGDDFGGSRTVARVKRKGGGTKKKKDDPMGYGDDDGKANDPFDGGKANCVFNPNAPGCVKKDQGGSLKDLDATLPDKLSNRQLSKALGKKKGKAKSSCGPKHSAAPGEVVHVKLSIEGGTGKVLSAEPQAPHNNALGNCVADILKKTEFPRFTSSQQGTTYPVTF